MKLLKKILILFNIIVVFALMCCYAAPYLNPQKYWMIAIWGMSFIPWLVINLIFGLIWLFIEKKYALISGIALLIGIPTCLKVFAFNSTNKNDVYDLSIMSYNVELFKLYDSKNGEKHKKKILKFIQDNPVDVYCFQEYFHNQEMDYFETTNELEKILPEYEFYFVKGLVQNNGNSYGTAIWSKFPILNKGKIVIDSTKFRTNIISYIDIKPKDDTLRIYNVHLASNHLNKNELDSIVGENDKKMNFVKKWVRKLRNGYSRRYNQIEILSNALKSCSHKKIIAGDFNDVPNSYTYKRICEDYEDSFLESGNGIGKTYTGKLPWLRIDYIFHSKEMESNYFTVGSIYSTDHFPIISRILTQ